MLRWLSIFALVLATLGGLMPRPAEADEQRAWVRAIPDVTTWNKYSRTQGTDEFGKFIIDVKTNEIYFFDVNLFNIHADFVLGVLLKQPWTADNIRAYNQNYDRVKPKFILGYLTHHLKVDRWTLSFWEGDKIDSPTILSTIKHLESTFFIKGKKLAFRPDSPMQEKVAKEVARAGIAVTSNDEIYEAAAYQAFNKGSAVGTLHIVPIGTSYESLTFDRNEIVLLQESYPDITPVAGILASTFSTPLSHVNLRATAWKIPNAGDKHAREKYAKLDGKIVFYEVRDTGMTLRAATAGEINEFSHRTFVARHVQLPPANLTSPRLAMLGSMHASDVVLYGTKAANLGEIKAAALDQVNIPDGFGIPFFYYVRHLQQHGLDKQVDEILSDARFTSDSAWRRTALETLKKSIIDAPLDPDVLDMLYRRVRLKLGGKGVFVRSSTNSEDLPGFNGAGLYDTVPNVLGRAQLENAVKTVWASVWNYRAVEERNAFGIDHRQVFPGVLVQIGVSATAAGVLVTSNLFDSHRINDFTINAKWGLGMRVVEGQKVPEQVVFDADNDGTKIVSRADDPVMLVFDKNGGIKEMPAPDGGVILTEARAKLLVSEVRRFVPLFSRAQPLDVEWVLEGEKMWIVQARPYVLP